MKTTISKIFLAGIFVVCFTTVYSQQMNSTISPVQYLSIYGEAGYSIFKNDVSDLKDLGGLGGGLGLGYEVQFNKLHIGTGLGFNYLTSTSVINNYSFSRQMLLPYPTMTYHYIFSNFNEKWTTSYLNVPVLFSYDFGKRYFAIIGAKTGLNLYGQYKSFSDVSIYASDTEFIDDLTDMPNHHITDFKLNGNGSLDFNVNVAATAEFGVNLDEWLAVKPRKLRRGQRPRPKTFRESLHYRASVFVDYGLLNINNYSKNHTTNTIIPDFESDETPLISNLNSVLGSNQFASHNLKPIYAGIKFAVLYEIPKKKAKPQRPVSTSRPVVVQRKTEPAPVVETPKLIGVIIDNDTKSRISANIELFKKDENVSVYQRRFK